MPGRGESQYGDYAATIERGVPRYPSAGRAVARFGAAREIHTLYKTEVQQHPLRRRSRLRKPLPCCAEEFDRAHPSIAWRRVPVSEMQRLRPIGRAVSLGRSDIWEVFSQPLRGLRPVVPSIATACSTRQ